jgi:hypothetical protein
VGECKCLVMWLVVLLFLCALGVIPCEAKAPPVVVVEAGGVRMTSTGVVSVEFLGALPKGSTNAVSVTATDTSKPLAVKSTVLASPWMQGLIYLVAGGVLVVVFQFVKAKLKLSGRLALMVVSSACAASGVGLSSLLGGLNVLNAGGGAAFVIASALLIYKLFVKK